MTLLTLLIWFFVAFTSAYIAGKFMLAHGYGHRGDLIFALLGSLLGGFLLSGLDVHLSGTNGEIVAAYFGAFALLFLARVLHVGAAHSK